MACLWLSVAPVDTSIGVVECPMALHDTCFWRLCPTAMLYSKQDNSDTMSITIAYWNVRGKCFVPRCLLHMTGRTIDYKNYQSPEQWAADKFSLGLDAPNLPYLINKDVKLTQTAAICNYICHKYLPHLLPQDIATSTQSEMWQGVAEDVSMRVAMAVMSTINDDESYAKKSEEVRDWFQKLTPSIDTQLSKREYLVSDEFLLCDAHFFNAMEFVQAFDEKLVTPNMKAYMKHVSEYPEVKAFLESPHCIRSPFLPFRL